MRSFTCGLSAIRMMKANLSKDRSLKLLSRFTSPISKQFLEDIFKELLILEDIKNIPEKAVTEKDSISFVFRAIYSLQNKSEKKENISSDTSTLPADGEFEFELPDNEEDDGEFEFDLSGNNDSNDGEFDFSGDGLSMDEDLASLLNDDLEASADKADDGFIYASLELDAYKDFIAIEDIAIKCKQITSGILSPNSTLFVNRSKKALMSLGVSEQDIDLVFSWSSHIERSYTGRLHHYVRNNDVFELRILEGFNGINTSSEKEITVYSLILELIEFVEENQDRLSSMKELITKLLSGENYDSKLFGRPYRTLNMPQYSTLLPVIFNGVLEPYNKSQSLSGRRLIKDQFSKDFKALNSISKKKTIIKDSDNDLLDIFDNSESIDFDGINFTKQQMQKFIDYLNEGKENPVALDILRKDQRTFGTAYMLYNGILELPSFVNSFKAMTDYVKSTMAEKVNDIPEQIDHKYMTSYNTMRRNAEVEITNYVNNFFIKYLLFPYFSQWDNTINNVKALLAECNNNITLDLEFDQPSKELIDNTVLLWRVMRER